MGLSIPSLPARLSPTHRGLRLAAGGGVCFFIVLSLLALHRQTPLGVAIATTTATSAVPDQPVIPSTPKSLLSPLSPPPPPPRQLPPHQYAYATFLAPSEEPPNPDDEADNYYLGARILAYQLLHAATTRTRRGIPFLVLCTAAVSQSKRDRLSADGAIIVPVDRIQVDWITPSRDRWKDQLAKLHLWKLTQYERVLFMDSDTLLNFNMDQVFADPASRQLLATSTINTSAAPPDEGVPPPAYFLGGVAGQGTAKHSWPPRRGTMFNGGFMLLQPSIDMFHYYLRVASAGPGRFDPSYAEQALLNYVHRKEGNLPWQQLNPLANVNWATAKDLQNGAWSVHAKWWHAEDQELTAIGWKLRWEMEGAAIGRAARELPR